METSPGHYAGDKGTSDQCPHGAWSCRSRGDLHKPLHTAGKSITTSRKCRSTLTLKGDQRKREPERRLRRTTMGGKTRKGGDTEVKRGQNSEKEEMVKRAFYHQKKKQDPEH